MPGPGLPTSITAGTTAHLAHHNAIHAIVNKIDTGEGAAGTNGIKTVASLEVAGTLLNFVPSLTVTGTTYTLGWADLCKVVLFTNAAAITVTVPTNAADALPIGYQTTLVYYGVGQPTITPAGGVTVNATPGLKLLDRNSSAQLLKLGTNEWLAIGRLSV